ncbi:MAG: DUF5615 family PIN-like protein [Acidobacteria bacterium]|nr:DUF5615 family PIN-like protein [Acidobacteriota bacterium]
MAVGICTDVQISNAVIDGLRRRGVDVLTAVEDQRRRLSDPALLDRATELGRIVYTQDADFVQEATKRLKQSKSFSGVVHSNQLNSPIGKIIDDLELIAKTLDPEDLVNRLEFIPY